MVSRFSMERMENGVSGNESHELTIPNHGQLLDLSIGHHARRVHERLRFRDAQDGPCHHIARPSCAVPHFTTRLLDRAVPQDLAQRVTRGDDAQYFVLLSHDRERPDTPSDHEVYDLGDRGVRVYPVFHRLQGVPDQQRLVHVGGCVGRQASASWMRPTISAGRLATAIPLSAKAFIFSSAVPAEPLMIAPA